MRQLRLLALAVPSVALALGAFACEDSSNGGGSITVPDAADFDSNVAFDAATSDVLAVDASVGISVLVANTKGAKADVRVIFQDATGAVIGETKTDANGRAVSTTAPSMVTVLFTDGTTSNNVTFMGVVAGDELRVAPSTLDTSENTVGNISTSFASSDLIASATSFFVQINSLCSANENSISTPIVVGLLVQCARPQNAVLASASNGGGPLGFAFMKGVTSPVGGNTVAVGPLTFAAPGTRTVKATNLPTDASLMKTGASFAIVGNDAFGLDANGPGVITQPAGIDFYAPVGFPEAFEAKVVAEKSINSLVHTESRFYRRETATADATATLGNIDFNEALPLLDNATVSGANGVARPEVTITSAGNTGAHSAYAKLSWFGPGAGTNGNWTFVYPGDMKTFKAPALPVDATAFVPHDTLDIQLAAYIDGSIFPDFATVKKLPIPPDADLSLVDAEVALPTNGTFKLAFVRIFND